MEERRGHAGTSLHAACSSVAAYPHFTVLIGFYAGVEFELANMILMSGVFVEPILTDKRSSSAFEG